MDISLSDVAYLLTLPAGALSLDGKIIYFIVNEDGELTEKHWNGKEYEDNVFISSDLRASPSAKYLLNQNTRRVFFPSRDNALKYAEYDEDEEEWTEDLVDRDGPIQLHPESKISGCFDDLNGQIIFFQDPSGALQCIRMAENNECTPLPPLPNINQSGNIIHTAYTTDDGVIHVVYINDSGHIHVVKLATPESQWQDIVLETASFGSSQITNFAITSTNEAERGFLAVVSGTTIVYIDPQGELMEVGAIDNKRFDPSSSEECANELYRIGEKIVGALGGGKK
ncbi:hypothetical protein BDV38DRAFT_49264 [Aspergillus pseudotamarii]|uniref:Fucose-specific lectin n=1 Tax=Aspergillus pseudotamarii TaxID=132259 RepID=A0A5N6S7Q7_ASPPS|nr:uncharacterized protein BDV38DRAFT_49264 [Aspergillus pseudotamarii]KAE8130706.1 hypothetical protein BDV38DRAFT_49264 [Aspergillus pseudotamarii]